mmetsp:Transcript_8271/g.32621  ORF Transcript_8271/g.32621 Transcript_8271/m.32621 type:complete len:227 (-) Transcript_8271:191-871(-)
MGCGSGVPPVDPAARDELRRGRAVNAPVVSGIANARAAAGRPADRGGARRPRGGAGRETAGDAKPSPRRVGNGLLQACAGPEHAAVGLGGGLVTRASGHVQPLGEEQPGRVGRSSAGSLERQQLRNKAGVRIGHVPLRPDAGQGLRRSDAEAGHEVRGNDGRRARPSLRAVHEHAPRLAPALDEEVGHRQHRNQIRPVGVSQHHGENDEAGPRSRAAIERANVRDP